MFTCRSVVLFLLLAAAFAVAQENGAAGIDPMAGTGAISNGVYTNTYYGFSFQFPSDWKVLLGPDYIAARGGCEKQQCRILALQSQKGMDRVTIDAHALAAGSSPQQLLNTAVEHEKGMGFQAAGAISESTAGNLKLHRQDLSTDMGNGNQLLESVIATQAKNDALVITIMTDSRNTLDQLASSMQTVSVAAAKPGQAPKQ